MTEHRCIVCPQLRNGEPRVFERANVCDGCRSRLRSMLGELVELYADLSLEKAIADQARVTGSRAAPIPPAIVALDLTLPPRGTVEDDLVPLYERTAVTVNVYRPTNPHTAQATYPKDEVVLTQRQRKRDTNGWLAYGPSTDQVGDPSVPAVLDSWARDWQGYRWAILPDPSVSALTQWLLDRLDWACDEHPAVDDFAEELAECVSRLRPRGPKVELKTGVPCRDCEIVSLFRWPGSDFVECASCPCLLTPEEYQRWTQLLATPEHQPWVRSIVEPQRVATGEAS